MNTNSKLSTVKTHSGAVCRMIGVLLGLFAFIWLPASGVGAAVELVSPENGVQTNPVTVFRWTRSDHPSVRFYALLIAENANMDNPVRRFTKPHDEAPQIAVRLDTFLSGGNQFFWRVIALNEAGNPIAGEESPIFSSFFEQDASGFTVITGIVKSDLNQAALVGAQVAISGAQADTLNGNSNVVTEFNGEYIIIALTTDSGNNAIDFPIKIGSIKEGFKLTTITLQEFEKVDGTIKRDIPMASIDDTDPVEPEPGISNNSALPAVLQLLLED